MYEYMYLGTTIQVFHQQEMYLYLYVQLKVDLLGRNVLLHLCNSLHCEEITEFRDLLNADLQKKVISTTFNF